MIRPRAVKGALVIATCFGINDVALSQEITVVGRPIYVVVHARAKHHRVPHEPRADISRIPRVPRPAPSRAPVAASSPPRENGDLDSVESAPVKSPVNPPRVFPLWYRPPAPKPVTLIPVRPQFVDAQRADRERVQEAERLRKREALREEIIMAIGNALNISPDDVPNMTREEIVNAVLDDLKLCSTCELNRLVEREYNARRLGEIIRELPPYSPTGRVRAATDIPSQQQQQSNVDTNTAKTNATHEVRFTNIDGAPGVIQKVGDQWNEFKNGEVVFSFRETRRDATYIYLYDQSRNLSLAAPINGGVSWVSTSGGSWQKYVPISPLRSQLVHGDVQLRQN